MLTSDEVEGGDVSATLVMILLAGMIDTGVVIFSRPSAIRVVLPTVLRSDVVAA